MKNYIGTKLIRATPMLRGDYNILRDWVIPGNENPADEGYLVEYLDGGKPNHPDFTGYISWSPSEQFEKAYRPTSGMTFGLALEALKDGERVARVGWNGKGMWLSLSHRGTTLVAADRFWSPHNAEFARQSGGHAPVLPAITMKTSDDKILMGWNATQVDMLAEDWVIVSNPILT